MRTSGSTITRTIAIRCHEVGSLDHTYLQRATPHVWRVSTARSRMHATRKGTRSAACWREREAAAAVELFAELTHSSLNLNRLTHQPAL